MLLGAGTDEFGGTLRPRDAQAIHDFEQLLDLFVRARVFEASYRDDVVHWELVSLRYSR